MLSALLRRFSWSHFGCTGLAPITGTGIILLSFLGKLSCLATIAICEVLITGTWACVLPHYAFAKTRNTEAHESDIPFSLFAGTDEQDRTLLILFKIVASLSSDISFNIKNCNTKIIALRWIQLPAFWKWIFCETLQAYGSVPGYSRICSHSIYYCLPSNGCHWLIMLATVGQSPKQTHFTNHLPHLILYAQASYTTWIESDFYIFA